MDIKKSKQHKLFTILFIIYLSAITWIILFKMQFGLPDMGNLRRINLIPYSEPLIVNNRIDFSEIFMNALAFLPFGIYCGALFPKCSFWKRCLPFIGASLSYEILQFIFAIGRTDVTDFINNTLGGIVGLLMYIVFCKLIKDEYKANKIILFFAIIGTVVMSVILSLIIIVNF